MKYRYHWTFWIALMISMIPTTIVSVWIRAAHVEHRIFDWPNYALFLAAGALVLAIKVCRHAQSSQSEWSDLFAIPAVVVAFASGVVSVMALAVLIYHFDNSFVLFVILMITLTLPASVIWRTVPVAHRTRVRQAALTVIRL